MIDFFNRRGFYIVVILLFLLGFCSFNLYFINQDHKELHVDESFYFSKSVLFYHYFVSGFSGGIKNFIKFFFYYAPVYKPPFMMLFSVPFYFVFGLSSGVARLSNFFYVFVSVFGLFFLAEELHSKEAGFLSAVLLLFTPLFFAFSRNYSVDFPLTAFIILTMLFFYKSKFFSSFWYSFLFGLSFSFGLLTKQTFLIYVLPWLFLEFFSYFKNSNFILNSVFKKNFFFSLIVILVLTLPWYLINFKTFFTIFIPVATNKDFMFRDIKSVFSYLSEFSAVVFGFYCFLLILLTFVFYFFVVNIKSKLSLFLGFFVPFLFLIIQYNRLVRFFLPLVPIILLISSISVFSIKNFRFRNFIFVSLLFLFLFQYFYINITNSLSFGKFNFFNNVPFEYPFLLYTKNEFEYDEILNFFKNENLTNTKRFLQMQCYWLTPFRYLFKIYNLPVIYTPPSELILSGMPYELDSCLKMIDNADYIIIFNKSFCNNICKNNNQKLFQTEQELMKYFKSKIDEFEPVFSSYSFYYRTNYTIYKRIKQND